MAVLQEYRLSRIGSLSLDLTRAVAAEVVVVGHLLNWLDLAPALREPNAPYMQNIAVLVFFILSGFVITYSVRAKMATGNCSFLEYFIDRFSRIFSGFIPCLFIVLVLDAIHIRLFPDNYQFWNAYNVPTFIGNLFMLQDHPVLLTASRVVATVLGENYRAAIALTSFGSGRPFWTIAVEWWIYLFFGWLILGRLSQNKPGWQYLVILGLFSIVPLYNLEGRGGGLTIAWIFGVAVGLGLAGRYLADLNHKGLLALSAGIFLLAMVSLYLFSDKAYDLFFAAEMAIAMFLLLEGLTKVVYYPPRPVASTIEYFAGFSMTLFLLHYALIELMLPIVAPMQLNPWLLLIGFLIVTNVISAFVATFTENKYRALRTRIKSALAIGASAAPVRAHD